MPRYVLAHDLGTTGNKATLYAEDGTLVASHTEPYPTHFFNGNWAEQDPNDWWRAVCTATRVLLQRVAAGDVAVVALSGQMMGCTPVDATGRALRPSLLYCDQRATTEAATLLQRISLRDFYAIVGHRISASYTLEKLMWLRRHEPDVFRQTNKTLCAKDYINCRLTGRMVTDFSDASGTNAFDLNRFRWSEEILGLAEIDPTLFPDAVDSATIIGGLTRAAAADTGLNPGTLVAAGGGDGSCAGVGVGCIRPGTAYNYLGSSSWIALTVDQPIVDPEMRTMNWAHCVKGYLHPSGTMQTAGSSFAWMRDQLCAPELAAATTGSSSVYAKIDKRIARVPVGANGLVFLPYLLGERTPWWNPDARGAFLGLNLSTRREDMLRAVMEGITLNLGLIVDIFRAHVPIEKITVIGGGAKSAVWRQIMADVYGCRVESLNYLDEATSMGAAVIGGVAAGLYPNFDVIYRFIAVAHAAEPRAENREFYQRRRALLARAYHQLEPVYAELAQRNPPS